MKTEAVQYEVDQLSFQAHAAWDPAVAGARPVVVVAHAWAGQGDLERQRAEQLAELGYLGVALDVHGRGVLGRDREQSAALIKPLIDDRELLARRLLAGLEVAAGLELADAGRMAAVGYCFGGLCVLDLARRNAPVAGVVSFHGLLGAPDQAPTGQAPTEAIRPKVLVLHGHDDPMAPPEAVLAFQTEMSERGADWQLHAYGGTMHAFTNPAANDADFGTVYEPRADHRSWASMTSFLAELFSTGPTA